VGLGTRKVPGDREAIKFLFTFIFSASLSLAFIFCSDLVLVQKKKGNNVMFRFFPLKMHRSTVGLHERRTPKFGLFQDFSTAEIMKQQMKQERNHEEINFVRK
jgi:hypothetical protein